MSLFRKDIVAMVERIIDAVDGKLPAANIAEARELLECNEWGVAFSLICTQLQEYEVTVSREVFDQMAVAGEKMEMDRREWENVEVIE
jgi:hypothetical protein